MAALGWLLNLDFAAGAITVTQSLGILEVRDALCESVTVRDEQAQWVEVRDSDAETVEVSDG